ncbi:MAG TPA: hypothetical protein VGR02_11260 [Thermoanaerobaculia bacterium]|jgi:hypothetical protein|nr:hypothetical protein [Thermoanaerobaculia bacterium]
MSWLARFSRRLKIVYLFLLPIRFSILALAAAAFAFILADQGQDIVRALGEVDPATGSAHWILIAVFLLLLNLLGYQIWFWARQMLRVAPPASADDAYFGHTPDPESEGLRDWALWLPRILGALLFVAVFYAFYKVRQTYGDGVSTVIPAILVIIAVSFVIFLVAVVLRRRWLEKKDDATIEHVSPGQLARSTRFMLIAFLVLELIFFIVSTANPTWFMGFGAGSIVLLTLVLWVPFGSVIVYCGMRMRVPILTFLVIEAFLVSPLADRNHIVRTVPGAVGVRPTVQQKFDEWYTRVSPNYGASDRIPVFIVATEGGGIRAGYWTAAVLDSLQDTNPLFRRNLFAVSSVSGGSLGTLTFSALLSEGGPDMHARGSKALGEDFLSPTLAAMTQSDFVQRFLPFGFPDRERALEEAWEKGYGNPTFARGLLDLYAKHADLPSVFINGTMVETGDRIITSNCDVRGDRSQLVFRDAFDGIALLGSDLPLSATAGMSARFTYVSPAGRIGTLGHVVDGGYFENSGAVTAAELVLLIRQHADPRLTPVVILIDYENCGPTVTKRPGDCRFADFNQAPPATRPVEPQAAEKWANEVLSPLRALLATRGARGRQAVGDVRTSSQFGVPPLGPVPNTVIEFRLVQREVSMPLGWMLSYQARKAIDGGVESPGNLTSRNFVAQWLGAAPRTDGMAVQANQQLQQVNGAKAP